VNVNIFLVKHVILALSFAYGKFMDDITVFINTRQI